MSSIILEARDVRYHYPRGPEAISGISFHIRRKEKIALVGPNGAGQIHTPDDVQRHDTS